MDDIIHAQKREGYNATCIPPPLVLSLLYFHTLFFPSICPTLQLPPLQMAPSSLPQTSKKRTMVMDNVRQEEIQGIITVSHVCILLSERELILTEQTDNQEPNSGKKRQRTVYEAKRDQITTSSVNFGPIVAGMAAINLQEQRSDKRKSRANDNLPAFTLFEAMTSIRIQEHTSESRQKEKQEEQQPAKK